MCGRYTLTATSGEIRNLIGATSVPDFSPSYNIAPSQSALMFLLREGKLVGEKAVWGLVPKWADASMRPLINARRETLLEKPSFRNLVTSNRCVIPADGFYEWETVLGKKHPVYFHKAERRPFAFAGLWESASNSADKTFVVITSEANEFMRPIHDRMPVILDSPDAVASWLGELDTRALKTPPSDLLRRERVAPLVNSPANDSAECIAPVGPQSQLSLFDL